MSSGCLKLLAFCTSPDWIDEQFCFEVIASPTLNAIFVKIVGGECIFTDRVHQTNGGVKIDKTHNYLRILSFISLEGRFVSIRERKTEC